MYAILRVCELLHGCNLWVPLLHTIRLWMRHQSNAIVLVVSLTVGDWQWGLPMVLWGMEGTTIHRSIVESFAHIPGIKVGTYCLLFLLFLFLLLHASPLHEFSPPLPPVNYTLIQKYVSHWGITQHIPQILIFWQFCVGSNAFRMLIYACWYGSWL